MEEAEIKGELLKRIEAEATGLDGKINDKNLSVPLDTVRNNLGASSKEITNHLKMVLGIDDIKFIQLQVRNNNHML